MPGVCVCIEAGVHDAAAAVLAPPPDVAPELPVTT
jgi:hypothetical protein